MFTSGRGIAFNTLKLLIVTLTITLYGDVFSMPLKEDDADTVAIILEDNVMDPIILVCDYPSDIELDEIQTVKWAKDNVAVYQWILGREPSTMPDFKNLVNESFEAFKDSQRQYSSLALINPTIKSSGIYKCMIQSRSKIYYSFKRLQIIDIRNYTFNINHRNIQNETHLECTVVNVFPKPTLQITSNNDKSVSIISDETLESEDGYFNSTITAATAFDDDDTTDTYKCTLGFEGFTLNLTTTVASNSAASSISFKRLVGFGFVFPVYYYLHYL